MPYMRTPNPTNFFLDQVVTSVPAPKQDPRFDVSTDVDIRVSEFERSTDVATLSSDVFDRTTEVSPIGTADSSTTGTCGNPTNISSPQTTDN